MMRWFNGYQGYPGYGMMGNFSWLGLFVCLLVFVLVVLGIVYIVRGLLNRNHTSFKTNSNSRSLEILNERFAKGEISKEEYDRIKKDL